MALGQTSKTANQHQKLHELIVMYLSLCYSHDVYNLEAFFCFVLLLLY